MFPILDDELTPAVTDPDWTRVKACLKWWEGRRLLFSLVILLTLATVWLIHTGGDIQLLENREIRKRILYTLFSENLWYTLGWAGEIGFIALVQYGIGLPIRFPRRLFFWMGTFLCAVFVWAGAEMTWIWEGAPIH